MDELNFLDGDSPAASEAVSDPAHAADAATDAPARGPDGRFVAAASDPAASEQPAEAAPAEQQKEPAHVPISALLDERDKRKAAEDRARALEAQQPQGEPAYVDPDIETRLLHERLNVSEDLAREKFGDTVVDAAKEAAIAKMAQSPAFQQEVLGQRNPYRYVVEWHQREQALSVLSDPADIEAFKAWKAAQANGQSAPAAAAAAPAPALTAPPAPPRSLASAPSAGGLAAIPTGPGTAFDSVIK